MADKSPLIQFARFIGHAVHSDNSVSYDPQPAPTLKDKLSPLFPSKEKPLSQTKKEVADALVTAAYPVLESYNCSLVKGSRQFQCSPKREFIETAKDELMSLTDLALWYYFDGASGENKNLKDFKINRFYDDGTQSLLMAMMKDAGLPFSGKIDREVVATLVTRLTQSAETHIHSIDKAIQNLTKKGVYAEGDCFYLENKNAATDAVIDALIYLYPDKLALRLPTDPAEAAKVRNSFLQKRVYPILEQEFGSKKVGVKVLEGIKKQLQDHLN